MTQKDFQVGQTVFLLQIKNCHDKSIESRIREVSVLFVGRDNITVDFWGKVRFDIETGLQQDIDPYSPIWRLFLSREDINDFLTRKSLSAAIRRNINTALHEMSFDEMQNLYSVMEPYVTQ